MNLVPVLLFLASRSKQETKVAMSGSDRDPGRRNSHEQSIKQLMHKTSSQGRHGQNICAAFMAVVQAWALHSLEKSIAFTATPIHGAPGLQLKVLAFALPRDRNNGSQP